MMSLESMETAVAVQKNNNTYYLYLLSLYLSFSFGCHTNRHVSYLLPSFPPLYLDP